MQIQATKAFWRQLLVLFLLNAGNVFAYLFQLVLAHSLSPAGFGSFNSLFSLTVWASSSCTAIQWVFAKQAVLLSLRQPDALRDLLRRGLMGITAVAVVALLVGVAVSPLLRDYLKLASLFPVLLTMLLLASTLIYPVVMGVIQGQGGYVTLGIGLSSVPFFRFVGGLVLVAILGMGVDGALWACILSSLGGLLIGALPLRSLFFGHRSAVLPGTWRTMVIDAWPIFAANTLVMAVGNIDLVMVRHYCSPEDSGLYATAIVLARIAMLLPGVLVNMIFPDAVRTRHSGGSDNRLLLRSLLATAALGGAVALVCSLWPNEILTLLMGHAYRNGGDLLRYLSLAMAVLAIANALFTYCLARNEYGFLPILTAGIVGLIIMVMVWHASAVMVARLALIAITTVLVASLLWYRWRAGKYSEAASSASVDAL